MSKNIVINEVTLLTLQQAYRSKMIDVIRKVGKKAGSTDFSNICGVCRQDYERVGGHDSSYWATQSNELLKVAIFNGNGIMKNHIANFRNLGIRPVIPFDDIEDIKALGMKTKNNLPLVKFGEYPQFAVYKNMNKNIENEFQDGNVKLTGKSYTINERFYDKDYTRDFRELKVYEYQYDGKKYVRILAPRLIFSLENRNYYEKGSPIWVEVEPITWYVDEKEKLLVSELVLGAGVRFSNEEYYNGDFKATEMYMFLNKYFKNEIIPSQMHTLTDEEIEQFERDKKEELRKREAEKQRNPYGMCLEGTNEEEIIKEYIECGIPLFLHGKSSDGKSARIKHIDPDCEILYLRNATPESLNGKCVYDQGTGSIIDIKPSWLVKLEERCKEEPNEIHILFLDEITNALPGIQGMAFNIVLDKEVNGKWKLPDNVRIVAAGNEMQDSIAANKLAEPLFNRFAHVYIETTVEKWLKWAQENNIHPAIYTYVAYKGSSVLRTAFNGETPNADPRKWEMASKILYRTKKPKLLKALIGESLATDFAEFCNQKVITLEDVLKEDFVDYSIDYDTAEKYATVLGLSRVEEENLETVRNFVKKLGKEFLSVFDSLWIKGDKKRLETIAALKMAEKHK